MNAERSDNLCNFYILPLLGVNKSSFGGSGNFINSYLTTELTHVIVELRNPYGAYNTHKEYVTDYYSDQGILTVVFNLPVQFRATAAKFKEGRYSQFSSEAKQLIKSKSGLNYKIPDGYGKLRSAKKLLALDKDKDLRKAMEEELAVKISPTAELMDIPDDTEFKELELMRVQQG
jgi:hypothetical protein